MITSVEAYAPSHDELLEYPFQRPSGSFLTDGEQVIVLPDTFADFRDASDEMLSREGMPLVEDRIPVVSYGANSNPYRLRDKMATYGDSSIQSEMQTIPHITGVIPETVVAWHGKPGQKGSTFAELYKGPHSEGKASNVHIAFLSTLQVAAIHATEGVTYHFVRLDGLVGEDKKPMPVYAYVAGKSSVLIKDGDVVPVARSGEPNPEEAMTAEQAVDYMLSQASNGSGSSTAKDLIEQMSGKRLSERKAIQVAISRSLGAAGVSETFSFPEATSYFPRADFDFKRHHPELGHPVLVKTLEEVIEDLRPEDTIERNIEGKDIAVNLRKRAHDELFHR